MSSPLSRGDSAREVRDYLVSYRFRMAFDVPAQCGRPRSKSTRRFGDGEADSTKRVTSTLVRCRRVRYYLGIRIGDRMFAVFGLLDAIISSPS